MFSGSPDIVSSDNSAIISRTPAVKWPEVLSLGALHAAVAISWIAYQEYQPLLLERFQVPYLTQFLIITKVLVLVLVPALAGWVADKILLTRSKYFIVYMVGISVTAMIFMIVASLITIGPNSSVAGALPIMIVLWLISMGIFISPAFSMLESFASRKNLPIVVGVIILITDIIYALEPLVVLLVQFFGDSLTFVVGAILVFGSGWVFNKVASDEVGERQVQAQKADSAVDKRSSIASIVLVGSLVGIGRAVLVEFVPINSPVTVISGEQLSFFLLGISALAAFGSGLFLSRSRIKYTLPICLSVMILAAGILAMSTSNPVVFTSTGIVLALSFGIAHMSSIPFAFRRLSVRQITFGIGAFLGASALAEGLLEIVYAYNFW